VGIDRLTAVDGRNGAQQARLPAAALDLDLDGKRQVRAQVLVTREREALAAPRRLRIARPAEILCRGGDDIACPGIVEVAQPELGRIGVDGPRQLVDETLDGED